ncbi:hypothetical protein N657DRAFT_684202 [Parathielavia appendiculata]|uniref:Uncharacterized protein n=1 Tax=Parathielavia appendiculata TaxID=2587402 RepID=A0AAN6TS60_9PEZI|nr:hypothetical protein N657DRAFT_684202 [Parathielavia appendiculata]
MLQLRIVVIGHILNRIRTGNHAIQTDYDKPPSDRTALTVADDAIQPTEDDGYASETSSSSSELPDNLIRAENDLLIPESAQIDRIFHNSRATWARFAKLADSILRYAFAAELANPGIMFKGYITGRPLWHVPDPELDDGSGDWLCAILSPKLGWLVAGAHFPPWPPIVLAIRASWSLPPNGPAPFCLEEPPRNSAEAMELLIEFCRPFELSRLGTDAMSQFLALLLGRPSIDSATSASECTASSIRQYVADLPYYMTLSMDPRSIAFVIWSIFWQPNLKCHLVSPWLSSALVVIKPSITQLAKVFSLRRPQGSFCWLSMFLLADFTVPDRMARFLQTLKSNGATMRCVQTSRLFQRSQQIQLQIAESALSALALLMIATLALSA